MIAPNSPCKKYAAREELHKETRTERRRSEICLQDASAACAAGALTGTPVLGALADAASNRWALAALVLLAGLVYSFFGIAAREVAQLRDRGNRDVELGGAAARSGVRSAQPADGRLAPVERGEMSE